MYTSWNNVNNKNNNNNNGKNTIVIIILIIHNNNIINYVYKVFPIEVSLQLWRSRFADLLEQADLEIFWDFMGL